MKNHLFLFWVMGMLLFFGDVSIAGSQLVTFVCEDRENFPFVLGDGQRVKAQNPGLSVELIRLAAARTGVSASFVRMPWNRCKNALRYGKADGLFNTGYTPEERSVGVFPMRAGVPDQNRRTATVRFSVYALKDSGLTWDGGYFNRTGITVGVPMGYCVAAELRRMGLLVEESPGVSTGFRKLNYNRVAAFVAPEAAGDHIIKNLPAEFGKVAKLEKPLAIQPFYLIFSHQFHSEKRDLAEAIWDAVAELRESPTMKTLEKKYADMQ